MKKCLGKIAVLSLVFGVLVGFVAVSFAQDPSISQYTSPAEYEEVTGKKISEFSEAPQLAELVEQGELPPVEERLPKEPVVVDPYESIGNYGGTWRMATVETGAGYLYYWICREHLLRWTLDGTEVVPNVAKAWTVSDDGRTYIFYLREGMRWSDGEPFTADDIMFWYEDVLLNDELTPVKSRWWAPGGELVKVEKLDNYTVSFNFAVPYGTFLEYMAFAGSPYAPKHYLEQFHSKYVSADKLSEMAKEAGYDSWYQLYLNKADEHINPELPRLTPWILKDLLPTRITAERNPYYWKVDSAGNQLPYLDRTALDIVSDQEIITMKTIAGDFDMQVQGLNSSDYPLFMENRERGDYRVIIWPCAGGSDAAVFLNQNYYEDPVIGDFLRNRTFRLALSHAIDRDEINEIVFYGLAEPRQMVPLPPSPYYDEELAYKYIEYDPEKAGELLDSLGLDNKDKDGFRLRPDGKPLELTITVTPHSSDIDVAEIVCEQWKKVGIKAAVETLMGALYTTRLQASQLQATIWLTDGNEHMPIYPYWTVPFNRNSRQAPLCGLWVESGGKEGVEPEGDLKKVVDLYSELETTMDPDKRIEIAKEIFRINIENLWIIGIVGGGPGGQGLVIARNDFRNVPERGVCYGDATGLISITHPEQFFIRKK